MQYYLAPMEGVTGYLFRNAHAACFGPADKYFTPFISTTQNLLFTSREREEILPEHNEGLSVVPQILTCTASHFIWAASELEKMGYPEVNLNLGCPARTVVTKKKGSGFLAFPDRLDQFLDEIFSSLSVKVSIKTRIGKSSAEEFDNLLEIFNRYPISELTVHPRIQSDYYQGKPDWDTFRKAWDGSRAPVCYNGDLFSPNALREFSEVFPEADHIMAGRGVIADPALIREFQGGSSPRKEELREFHDRVYSGYRSIMSGAKPVLAHMKEFWSYLLFSFPHPEAYMKRMQRVSRCEDYELIVSQLFQEQEPLTGGYFIPPA